MNRAVLDLRSRCPRSLETYRDFAFVASWAVRRGIELEVVLEEHHRRGLDWLELPYRDSAADGLAPPEGLASPGGKTPLPSELARLPALVDPAGRSLDALRSEGYLSETVFAALIRANYGEASSDYFPTRMELSLTYDPGGLREGESRWDEGYLEECQRFFMEELTPSEALRKVGEELTGEARLAYDALLEEAREECEGLVLLAVEAAPRLRPVVELLNRLAQRFCDPQSAREAELLFLGFEELADEMAAVLGELIGDRVRPEQVRSR